MDRLTEARAYHHTGMQRVATIPEPAGQKFPIGTRVRITDDLGQCMSHFPSGRNATVEYVYGHAYGSDDVKSYALNVDGCGVVAWYHEGQLTEIIDE